MSRHRCGSIIRGSFVLVVLFAIWRYFPYAFISFLAILQTIDKSLYEAAEMDGANAPRNGFVSSRCPRLCRSATVVTLRTIWMFMFADVYLLTRSIFLPSLQNAFAFRESGGDPGGAFSIIIFAVILLTGNG